MARIALGPPWGRTYSKPTAIPWLPENKRGVVGNCQAFEKGGRKFGGRNRPRTWGPLIKSQLLYQLS